MDVVSTALGIRGVARALTLSVLLGTVVIACGPSSRPLANTEASPSALASAILDALTRRDADRLQALALDEREFREHVWPELPASRPERNLPISYVWGDLNQKSQASLGRVLAAQGGKGYALVSLAFSAGTTPYKTFVVHRKAVVTVRDGAGAQTDLRLFGSVIEQGGRFKVFSFVTDE